MQLIAVRLFGTQNLKKKKKRVNNSFLHPLTQNNFEAWINCHH